jgi:hypothetical protein
MKKKNITINLHNSISNNKTYSNELKNLKLNQIKNYEFNLFFLALMKIKTTFIKFF